MDLLYFAIDSSSTHGILNGSCSFGLRHDSDSPSTSLKDISHCQRRRSHRTARRCHPASFRSRRPRPSTIEDRRTSLTSPGGIYSMEVMEQITGIDKAESYYNVILSSLSATCSLPSVMASVDLPFLGNYFFSLACFCGFILWW